MELQFNSLMRLSSWEFFYAFGIDVNELRFNLIKKLCPTAPTLVHDHEICCGGFNIAMYLLTIYGSIFLNPKRISTRVIPFQNRHEFNWKRINIPFMFTRNTITDIDQSTAVTIKPALNLNAFEYLSCAWRWNGAKISHFIFSSL